MRQPEDANFGKTHLDKFPAYSVTVGSFLIVLFANCPGDVCGGLGGGFGWFFFTTGRSRGWPRRLPVPKPPPGPAKPPSPGKLETRTCRNKPTVQPRSRIRTCIGYMR